MFYKKNVLQKEVVNNFEKFTGKYLCWSLFIKVGTITLSKKTPAQAVSCKFCNILNSTSFVKQIRMAISEHT